MPLPLTADYGSDAVAAVIRPDFQANAERCYRIGYRLMIASLMGHRLDPEQLATAQRASFTSQRRLNEQTAALSGMDDFQSWSADDEVSA